MARSGKTAGNTSAAGKGGKSDSPGSGGSSGGGKDIVSDYSWTSIPKNSEFRKKAPHIIITGYKLNTPSMYSFVASFVNAFNNVKDKQSSEKFYDGLYGADKKETYKLPYFSSNVRTFSNNFADTFSNVSSIGGGPKLGSSVQQIAGEVSSVVGLAQDSGLVEAINNMSISNVEPAGAGGAVGTYIETPKFYQFENTDAPISVSFVLSNTINEGDAEQNAAFIEEFTRINRPSRSTGIALKFPLIWEILVPGTRYIRWASLSNFSVELLGTRRMINNKLTPEGYRISMDFTSLTIEVENFMDKI